MDCNISYLEGFKAGKEFYETNLKFCLGLLIIIIAVGYFYLKVISPKLNLYLRRNSI